MSPTIIRTASLKVRIYAKDHNPPHVHVAGPGAEAIFRIDDMKCLYSRGFSRTALRRIGAFLVSMKAVILEAWDEYQDQ